MPPLPLGLLAWLFLVVLWLTWTPTGAEEARILLAPPTSPRVLVGNVFLLAPIAVVVSGVRLASEHEPRGRRELGAILTAGLAAAVLSTTIELGQFRVPGRTVSPFDLALNTLGGVLAGWGAVRLHRLGVSPRTLVVGTAATVFLAVLVFLATTGSTATRMLRAADWHVDEYGIVAGDEVGGGRAYVGSVTAPRICGGRPGTEVCVGPGAPVEDRAALVDSVRRTQRVEVSATVVSGTSEQWGPARIVTFSGDIRHRNLTLGQADRDLVLRVRTPLSGPNATRPQFVLPAAVPEDVPTRISAQYRPGRVGITAEAAGTRTRGVYRWGHLSGWRFLTREFQESVRPRDLLVVTAVAAAAFALPLGMATGWLLAFTGPLRPFAALLLPPTVLTAVTWPLGSPAPAHELAFCAAFGLVGFALGRRDRLP